MKLQTYCSPARIATVAKLLRFNAPREGMARMFGVDRRQLRHLVRCARRMEGA